MAGRAIEVAALLPVAVTLLVLESLRVIPSHPARFVGVRRVLLGVAIALFVFFLAVVAGRFYYLHT